MITITRSHILLFMLAAVTSISTIDAGKKYLTDTQLRNIQNRLALDDIRVPIYAADDIDATDKYGRTALMLAAGNNNPDMVRLLLENGADADREDSHGLTALWMAVDNDYLNVAKELIDAKANLEIGDNYDRTPLYIAVQRRLPRMVKLLVDAGADVDALDKDGTSIKKVAESLRTDEEFTVFNKNLIKEYLQKSGSY